MNINARNPVNGTVAESNHPPLAEDDTIGTIRGECNGARYELSVSDCVRKNLFLEGSPRAGKSNCVNLLLQQIIPHLGLHDRAVIFDTRGNYYRDFFCEERDDVLISTLPQHSGRTAKWNVFSEVETIPAEDQEQRDMLIREIGEYLVEDTDAPQHKFFIQGARNLLCAVIDQGLRNSLHPKFRSVFTLDNHLLRQVLCDPAIFDHSQSAQRHPLLYFSPDSPYGFVNGYFSDPTWKAPLDFKAFANNAVNSIFFGEAFGAKNGDFSVKRFAKESGGRTLFIEYDVNHGKTLDRVYSLLIDLLIKELLSNGDHPGTTYLFLDEINLLSSKMLETACLFGNGQNIRIIATCQSHSGLYEKYGEDRANSILSCFSAFAFFSCGDPVAREWIKRHYGKSVVKQLHSSGYTITSTIDEDYVVNDPVLNDLRVGEAVISIPEDISGKAVCPPFVFRFGKYSN